MTFFHKQTHEENLAYDNTAFFYFAISICITISIVLLIFVLKSIYTWMKCNDYGELEKDPLYKQKIRITKSVKRKKLFTMDFIIKISVLVLNIILITICINLVQQQGQQLISFDPYDILGLDMDASQSQIKRAYRKLALQLHPDRTNDPLAAQTFILISKAYKCLTDKQVKQNCLKYGNPDGQISSQIGIGLPSFILQPSNKYYVLFFTLGLLIILLPYGFMKWVSTLKNKNKSQLLVKNTKILTNLINPKMNNISFCIILGCMSEFNNFYFPNEILNQQQTEKLKQIIIQQSTIKQENISILNQSQLYRIYSVYQYLHNLNHEIRIALKFPELCEQIIKLMTYYARRSFDNDPIPGHSSVIASWYGLIPLKKAIDFNRRMYNQGESQQTEMNPKIKVEGSVKIQQQEVSQLTTDDVAIANVKITRQSMHLSYVRCQNYPLMQQQRYILVISHNSNLLSHLIFNFQSSSKLINHSFKLPRLPKGKATLNIKINSLCYNLQINKEIQIEIFERIVKRAIVIHEEDQQVQKIDKNFFEALITFGKQNQSDMELSDQEDEVDNQVVKPQKSKIKEYAKASKKLSKVRKSLKVLKKKPKLVHMSKLSQ